MRTYFTVILFFALTQILFGQEVKSTDKTSVTLDLQIEKVTSNPYYLLLIENSENIKINKSDLKKLNEKWVSNIDIWTTDEKKKEYGYNGKSALVLITLKKKRIDDYLDIIGKIKR